MLQLLQHALYTAHLGGDASGRGPSSRIWSQVRDHGTPAGANSFVFYGDDFLGYNALDSDGAFGALPYLGFLDAGGTVTNLTTPTGGVIRLTSDNNADDDISIGTGNVAGKVQIGEGVPGTLTSTGGMLLFECRVKTPDTTDGDGSWMIGLTEPGCVADDGNITDAHGLGAKDQIGFYVLDADNDAVNFGYNVTGGSAVSVATQAIANDTFIKLGFVYDPRRPAASRIKWYVNGVEQATTISATTIAATTFPGGQPMDFYAQAKTDASAVMQLDADWWFLGHQLPS